VYRAIVRVTLRPSILDPQGKAISHALHNLGHSAIREVRAGKLIELAIETDSPEEAERIAREAAERLLANPVMEDFSVQIEPLASTAAT
jgi:phosphoribosylformylglycinamidine synthase subunit PurS